MILFSEGRALRVAVNIAVAVAILSLSSCTLYRVKQDTPLKVLDNNVEHGKTGSAYMWGKLENVKHLASDKYLYFSEKKCGKEGCYYAINGINNSFEETCNLYSTDCDKKYRDELKIVREIPVGKLKEVTEKRLLGPMVVDYYIGESNDVGFKFAVWKYRSIYQQDMAALNYEYIDFTDRVRFEASEFDKAKALDTVEAYRSYFKMYPRSAKLPEAKKFMFWKMFDVKLLSSDKSQQRSFQRSGLTTSGAGACQDFTKQFEIVPKPSVTMDTDFDVSVKSTLNRKYSPINAGSESGPLVKVVPVTLNRSNNYRQSVNVDYECVPTSITVSNAILNGIAKLASMFGQNVGQTTYTLTLSSTSFEVDVVDVK